MCFTRKTFKVYAVSRNDCMDRYLTYVTTRKQAFEYVENTIKGLHIEHYIQWCELRTLDPEDDKAWKKYFQECVDPEEKGRYYITTFAYSNDTITSIMRMFFGCIPIGCSFEDMREYSYALERLAFAQPKTPEEVQAIEQIKGALKIFLTQKSDKEEDQDAGK